MNFGLTFEKLLLFGLIAALLIGPERLPRYAEALTGLIRRGAEFLRGAKTRMEEDLGPGEELDWRKLDPRQYDPRRIIRDALFDDGSPGSAAASAAAGAATVREPGAGTSSAAPTVTQSRPVFTAENPPPFDAEST